MVFIVIFKWLLGKGEGGVERMIGLGIEGKGR